VVEILRCITLHAMIGLKESGKNLERIL